MLLKINSSAYKNLKSALIKSLCIQQFFVLIISLSPLIFLTILTLFMPPLQITH